LARYAYTWNKVGNLTLKRSLDVWFNPSPSLPSERYDYDDLYRLRFVRDFNPVLKEEIRYAGPNGNISFLQEHVSGLALNYTYHANRPHAVRCAGNNRYEYDANSQTKTSYQSFIMAEGRFVAVVKRESTFGAFAWFEPVTLDERGDVVALMGWGGTSQSFDAFGQRRDPSDWTGSGGSAHVYGGFEMGRRGFTGHEHIDSIGLIHMNGRVQHPLLGRMISPDPTIPYLYDTQSLNRYSYARNNPITLVDPSGYCWVDSAARGCLQDLLNYIDSVTVTAERYPAWDSYSFEQIERLLTRYMSDELRALEASMQALRGMEEVVVESTKPQRPQGKQACYAPTGNQTSPWGLGWEWLTGTGPRARSFSDGDAFTELLRGHRNIQNLVSAARSGSIPSTGQWDYSVGGVEGVGLYLQDYSNHLTGGRTGNLAVTFLGSYDVHYSISGNTLSVQITNASTIQSATHPPIVG
jgi:RHS repeat-associated protein